jgi:hypothetical protein
MMLANPIILQQQPTPVCCTATCIAMALGVPVTDLGGYAGVHAHGLLDFGVYLAERGVWLRYLDRGDRFWSGSLYLISVRSLNKIGTDHAILLDTRACVCDEPDGWCRDWKVFDPNDGIEGKEVYRAVWETHAIKACQLKDRSNSGAGIA